MPVILHERDYDEWLLRDEGPPPVHLLQSFPAAEMQVRPVSRDVGNVKNNHPELLNSK
jgi:putative SOS response-associated peptidase YedK